MKLVNVKQLLSFIFERIQMPNVEQFKMCVCGGLCSLVNVILRRGSSTSPVTSLLILYLLLYFGMPMVVTLGNPLWVKQESLEDTFCLSDGK